MKNIVFLLILMLAGLFLFGCTQNTNGNALLALDKNKNLELTDANTLDNNSIDKNQIDQNSSVYNNLNDFKRVKAGDTISVDYTGRFEDGSVFDSSLEKTPLEFTVGAGKMIKGFDEGVVGMKIGETKLITISPEDAYGAYDSNLIRVYDRNAPELSSLGTLKVGMELSVGGRPIVGIIGVTDGNVTIDFNHKLAGKTLIFEVTLLSIN